jgi:carotenoid cleavage dioxygenase
MPRDGGGEDVVWLQTDPCYVFHPMNAHSEGSRVIAEVARYPVVPLFGVEGTAPAVLTRWLMDLESGTVKEEPLDEDPSEFPRFDERYAGRAYRHGYSVGTIGAGAASDPQDFELPTGAIFHYDFEKGQRQEHRLASSDSAGEPIFVPRRPDAPEGDGFLLVIVFRGEERRSDLLVLDAQNIDAQPLATVHLPHRIPAGFHGNWRPDPA